MNFGTYAAPDRRLVFGINDFDETLPGPFEWDVKRLVASFAVAGRDRGFSPRCGPRSTSRSSRATGEAMQGFAAMRNLDLWYARLDVDALMQDVESIALARGRRAHGGNVDEGAHEGQPQGVLEAHPASSTASRGSSATRR